MALGSRERSEEFLVRSCGILVHGDAILFQEAPRPGGGVDYALPGGHLEFGESLAMCLTREIFEETGLNVEADKLVYIHEHFYEHRGVRSHELGFYFLVDLSSEFPTPDAEGYVPCREESIRMRLLPLASLGDYRVLPEFLEDALPRDAKDLFAHPARHLVTRGA